MAILDNEVHIPILWTREKAQQLADMGLIPERYDLIEGVLYRARKIAPQERHFTLTLYHWLSEVFELEFLLHRMPVTLALLHEDDGDLEPDVTVLNKPEPRFTNSDPTAADIVLCVEVVYVSRAEETTRKASIYAQNGIAEYWIADVKRRQMIVHREPNPDGYHLIKIYTAEEYISPIARPEASISVSELFPPLDPSAQ